MKILTLLLMFLFCACSNAAIINVPTDYATVQLAVNAAQPGDTIMLASGTYNESIITARNGSSGSRIIIDGQNIATVKSLEMRHSYHTIQNLRISGYTTSFGSSISIRRNAHFLIVNNCNIDNNRALNVNGINWESPSTKPFGTDAASDCLIQNTTIQKVEAYICVSMMGDRNVIEHCKLLDCREVDNFRVWGRNNIVRYNLCDGNIDGAAGGNHPDFAQTFGTLGYGSDGVELHHNVVINSTVGAICQLEGNLIPEVKDWYFHHNVFVGLTVGASNSIPGVRWENNTFYQCSVGTPLPTGERYHWYQEISSSSPYYAELITQAASGTIVEGRRYSVYLNGSTDTVTYAGTVYGDNGSGSPSELETFFGTSTTTYTKSGAGVTVWPSIPNIPNNVVTKNNMFIECGTNSSNGWYGITIVNDSSQPSARNSPTVYTGYLADYNMVSGVGGVSKDIGIASYPDSGWHAGKFYELHGINGGSPAFHNTSNILGPDGIIFTDDDGLKITAGSVAINAGESGVDIGAYEYVSGGLGGSISTGSIQFGTLNINP